MINCIFRNEKELYSSHKVSDKYDLLEEIRLSLDVLYSDNREQFEHCKRSLKKNTWDALEDAWTLWNPAPNKTGKWGGSNNMTFILDNRSPYYAECKANGFFQCTYDKHGSSNFDLVTYEGSIVDISDLYDSLSVDVIAKRGGSRNSLQEIAQDRMANNLDGVLRDWAQEKGVKYNQYDIFYQWRDEHDLVPHEDTNCRTMRLVFRPAHKAFTHRGGVSNAINIKNHF